MTWPFSQRMIERLLRPIRPKRPQPHLGAFNIPIEIVLCITDHLSNAPILALALTCRALYAICFFRHSQLEYEDKQELLTLLARDIRGTAYFCELCAKLHRLGGDPTEWWCRGTSWTGRKGLLCQKERNRIMIIFRSTCVIPFPTAHLIMNRHFFGPAYGLPLDVLTRAGHSTFTNTRGGFGISQETESTEAHIVDDVLILLTTRTYHNLSGDSYQLRTTIENLDRPFCTHLAISFKSDLCKQIPELQADKVLPSRHFQECQSIRSCVYCLTDYHIDISWHGDEQGYVIKAWIYRQLGSCRLRREWSWQSMLDWLVGFHAPRCEIIHPPGIIIDRWKKAEGISCTTRSEWIIPH